MPCRNPCRLYTHLACAYSIGPSSVVWSSKLGPAPPFPPLRVLEVQWSRALSLVIHLAFTYSVGPSSVLVWSSELGPAPPFPPMSVLEVQCSQALSLVIRLAFTYSVGPSSVLVWSGELGPALPFPPMSVLEVQCHGLSASCVKGPSGSHDPLLQQPSLNQKHFCDPHCLLTLVCFSNHSCQSCSQTDRLLEWNDAA